MEYKFEVIRSEVKMYTLFTVLSTNYKVFELQVFLIGSKTLAYHLQYISGVDRELPVNPIVQNH